jgi:hypothetical protein
VCEEAIASLVAEGLLVDSGECRRSRSGKLQIVWIARNVLH